VGRNVPPVSALEDVKEFGRAVGAARGSMTQPADKKTKFAALMGTSVPTLTRWEEGHVGSIGTLHERRQLAERIVEASGCPPEWFGLSELEPSAADQLRREFEQKLVEAKNEVRGEAAKELGILEAQLRSQGIAVPKPK
jgi:transcriptional regulator with XRE-family HTH domain